MTVLGAADVEAAGPVLRLETGTRLTPLALERANELGVRIEWIGGAPAPPKLAQMRPVPGNRWSPPTPPATRAAADLGDPPARSPGTLLYRRGAPLAPELVPPRAATPVRSAVIAAPHASVTASLCGCGGHGADGSPRRAAVVGAGHVGATAALRLAEADVFDEVVLLDVVEGLASGLALDLWHSAALGGFATRLTGGTDYSAAAGAEYVVVAAGRPRQPGMSRTDLTAANATIVREVASGLRAHAPDAVVVVITNPLDEMTHLMWQETGFPPSRVLGMAGVLDTTRFCSLAAAAAGVRPDAVSALALGSHGEEMVVPLSQARIGYQAIERRLDRATLDALVTRTRDSGAEVVRLLEKGSAYFAPSAAAARMVLAMATGRDEVLPCCVLADGSYGISGVYVGLPTMLGPHGVAGIVELDLTPAELAELQRAAASIAERIQQLAGV